MLGIGTLYTRLGEARSRDGAGAQAVADHYLELLARISAAEIDGEISVKPTQLGLDIDEDVCFGHLRVIAAAAEAQGSYLWIDMEDSALRRSDARPVPAPAGIAPSTGICLQAYLRRTAKDVERLLPLGPAIRLVKGAYDEPIGVAFKSSKEIDANFLGLAVTLLRESRTRADAGRPRDARCRAGRADRRPRRRGRDRAGAFEIQMLYGVRAKEQRRLARSGYRVQTLIAYGGAWSAWNP